MTNFVSRHDEEVNTTTAGDQQAPLITPLANGGWVVAWSSTGGEVHAQLYDAAGTRVGTEFAVLAGNPQAHEVWSGFSLGGLAGLADGSFVVTGLASWMDPGSGNPPYIGVFGQRVSATGELQGAPSLVTSDVQLRTTYLAAAVLALPDGGYSVVVQEHDAIPQFMIMSSVARYDATGTLLGTGRLDGTLVPAAQVLPTGNLIVASGDAFPLGEWLLWQVVTPSGQELAGSAHPGVVYASETNASVAVLANGHAVILWKHTFTETSWRLQFVDAMGQAIGPEQTLPITDANHAKVSALAQGGFLVSWEHATGTNSAELLGRYFDATGAPAGDVVTLDSSVYVTPSLQPGNEYEVVATADGGFLLVSQNVHDGVDVEMQKFDPVTSSSAGHIDVSGGITAIPAGDFTIRGGAGVDQIAFSSAHTAYIVTGSSITGPEGTDTLQGIERIRFGDGFAIALDVSGDAGQAYRLYQAAFDRAPDLPGLGYQMNDLDTGHSLNWVAANFIASPEFQSKYGSVTDDAQFITLLYQHVLHRDPEQAGMQFHLDEFARGETRADMLTHFSESPENQANVIGQIADGMSYVPLA